MHNTIAEVEQSIDELKKIATLFYQGNNMEAFQSMEEGTQKILSIVDNMTKLSERSPDKVGLDLNFVNAALTEIMRAFEHEDGILLADLLTYELLDHVEIILNQWRE